MTVKRRNNKKAMKRAARHYKQLLKKEGTDMMDKENISATTESMAVESVTAENTVQETGNQPGVKEAAATTQVKEEAVKEETVAEKAEVSKECTACAPKEEKAAMTEDVTHKLYIQYNDLEFSDKLMFEAAVTAYCNEYNQDKSVVSSVNLYVKPQEGKAYYVINDDAGKSGSIDL